jgi:hypothetical protein
MHSSEVKSERMRSCKYVITSLQHGISLFQQFKITALKGYKINKGVLAIGNGDLCLLFSSVPGAHLGATRLTVVVVVAGANAVRCTPPLMMHVPTVRGQ